MFGFNYECKVQDVEVQVVKNEICHQNNDYLGRILLDGYHFCAIIKTTVQISEVIKEQ